MMKPIIVLFVLFFNEILSEPIKYNRALPYLFTLRIKNECLDEYGIETDINYNSQEGVPALTELEMYCVAACIYRDDGFMKSDGTIDTDKADEYFGDDHQVEKDIFFSIVDACNDGITHCHLVQCMFYELRNYVIQNSTPRTNFTTILPDQKMFKFE